MKLYVPLTLLAALLAPAPARGEDPAGNANLDPLVQIMSAVDDPAVHRDLLRGISDALKGRRQVPMPKDWPAVYPKLSKSPDAEVRDKATALALLFGDPAALESLRKLAADAKADAAARAGAIETLTQAKDAKLVPLLHDLLQDAAVRGQAIRALAASTDDATAGLILRLYPALSGAEKRDAVNTLASRRAFALALLDAVESGKVSRGDLSAYTVRQLTGLNDKSITARVEKVWGALRPTDEEKAKKLADYRKFFKPEVLKDADLRNGRAVYAKTCGQCHVLFDSGGKVGPELTGSQRTNLDYVLENVADPNAAVARDYQMSIIDTKDGRTLTGIVTAENANAVTVRTTNEDVTVPVNEIEKRRVSQVSMMPEGLLDALSDEDAKDLVGYLASPKQVELPAEAGTTR
jgi:putative heme-binding domain-containing protein